MECLKGTDHLKGLDAGRKTILKLILKKQSARMRIGIKDGKHLGYLSDYYLLKKDAGSWSLVSVQ